MSNIGGPECRITLIITIMTTVTERIGGSVVKGTSSMTTPAQTPGMYRQAAINHGGRRPLPRPAWTPWAAESAIFVVAARREAAHGAHM
ncbi:hypothetical protein KGO5_02416 [Sinorhizobium sp. KGO-5]|nr:hypothetical protein KGO5_02416 [Sinorhizobium sp. KGO-5]